MTASSGNIHEGEILSDNTIPISDETTSYIQVVVQKHHRKTQNSLQKDPPRLPIASSPIAKENTVIKSEASAAPDAPPVMLMPQTVYFACPNGDINNNDCLACVKAIQDGFKTNGQGTEKSYKKSVDGRYVEKNDRGEHNIPLKKKIFSWTSLLRMPLDELSCDDEPQRVRVFTFSNSAERLFVPEIAPFARVDLITKRGERMIDRTLATLVSILYLFASIPIKVGLHALRLALRVCGAACEGALRALLGEGARFVWLLHELALVPLSAMSLGAVQLLSASVRPLLHLLPLCAEPLARVFGSLRLCELRA